MMTLGPPAKPPPPRVEFHNATLVNLYINTDFQVSIRIRLGTYLLYQILIALGEDVGTYVSTKLALIIDFSIGLAIACRYFI